MNHPEEAARLDALLLAARQGDRTALETVTAQLAHHLYSEFANRNRPRGLGPSRGMSDLVQETLLGAQQYLTSFRGESYADFRQWARKYLHNRRRHWVRNYLARNSQRQRQNAESVISATISCRPENQPPGNRLADEEEAALVHAALARLRVHDQFIIRLRVFNGLPPQEIAKLTQSTAGAVQKAYERALRRFQQAYRHHVEY